MRTSLTLALLTLLGACGRSPPAVVAASPSALDVSPPPVSAPVAAGQLAPAHAVTTKRQPSVPEDVSTAVAALLRKQRGPYADIDPRSCAIQADDAGTGAVLRCHKRGACTETGDRRTFVVTILVEDSGLRLLTLAEGRVDDGSCGCF